MKTIKTRNGFIITICVLLLGGLSVFSCDVPLSLGSRLNMDPPVVSIEKPDFLENISGTFVLAGTASDNEEVAILSVTIERVNESEAWKQEWESVRGVWQSRLNGGSWEYAGTVGTIWSIQKSKDTVKVEWSKSISTDGFPNGEYLITVGAENNVNTKGALQQRRVVIDNDPPVVKVLSPVLYFDDYEGDITYTYNDDVAPEFDTYNLMDPSVLDRLHNKSIMIQYKLEDNFTIDTLYFQLADKDGNIYYNPDGQPAQNISWSGSVDIPAAEIKDPSDDHVIGAVSGEKRYLQVISRASDKAGNAKTGSHGWLVYWPDADRPWVSGVGHETVPQDYMVFPGSGVQGQAYDNDGVNSVSYKIYNKRTDVFIKEGSLNNIPLVEDDPPTMFFSWGFTAPIESDEYYIIIDCTDMYGTAGYQVKRYFYVQSTSAPTVTLEAPEQNESLFGDNNGKFTIKGFTGDGSMTGPAKLFMVWLNPNDTTGSRFDYQSSEFSGWTNASLGGFTDTAQNIIWELPLDAAVNNTSTNRRNRDFKKDINLFTDLNIGIGAGKVPLTSQTFIFKVEGGAGTGLTAIKSLSFRGDVTPPNLTITKIEKKHSGAIITYPIESLIAGNAMAALEVNDEITLSGTWGDDSFNKWLDTGKIVDPKVLWNNKQLRIMLNTNGTWTALNKLTTAAETQIGSAYITASIGDFGKNITEKSYSLKVNTVNPVLMYITSDNEDGYYNAGKTITVNLEFNKNVTFNSGATLTLNSGGTAAMSTSGSKSLHKFTYTVGAGHKTGKLGVTSVNYSSCEGDDGAIAILDKTGKNIDVTKTIVIDTTAPKIANVQSLNGTANGTSYFNAGKTLYLLVKFNEDITFTPGTTSLSLNSGGSGASPAMSGTDSLLFTYTVAAGDNYNPLAASGLKGAGGGVITDLAGNNLIDFTIPAGQNINNINGKTIVIDTTAPSVLSFNPSSISGTVNERNFTLNGIETGAIVQYSVNGTGGPWINYPSGGVTLKIPGTYNVSARQIDLAGNISPATAVQTVIIIPNTPLLTSFGGTPGTCKVGDNIDIKLNFRGAITVSGTNPSLVIEGTNPGTGTGQDKFTGNALTANAAYLSGGGTSTLVFRYTVKSGDSINVLRVKSINITGTTLTEAGNNVTSQLVTSGWAGNLDSYTTIKIDTSLPAFSGATLSGTTLTLNFNKEIFKGNGNITLEHQTANRRAPSVLTKAEYLRYGGAAALGSYYTVGTNGTDASGNPDLTEKYILNYNLSNDNSSVVNALANNGAYKVTVSVVSSAVTKNGNSLTVNLSDTYGYVLPVKGVDYTLTFPAGLVQDGLGNLIAANTGTTIANPGVNPPFIRIQKNRGTVTDGTPSNVTVGGTPSTKTYWVKNGVIQISASEPTTSGTWAKADNFSIDIGPSNLTQKIKVQTASPGSYYISSSSNPQIAGDGLFRSNTNPENFGIYGWGSNPPGGYTQVTGTYWINPYEYTIDIPVKYNPVGQLIFNKDNIWVDTSTVSASNKNEGSVSPGAGWLRVTETTTVGGGTFQVPHIISTQPLTANVKIDCQTPGATIRYTSTSANQTAYAGKFGLSGEIGHPTKPGVTMPNASGTTYSTPFTIGDNTDNAQGQLFAIRAESANGTYTATAYEKAARSVIRFKNIAAAKNWDTLNNLATNKLRELHLWLRGGDGLSGSSLTPGFPLSWSDQDYTGARLMTKDGATNDWYWITWEVSSQAYFHFVAGTTTTAAQTANGPHDWGWGKNAWSFQHAEFPLYAGGSLVFSTATQVTHPATETFEFYDTFSGSR